MKKILYLHFIAIFMIFLVGCNNSSEVKTNEIINQLKQNGINGNFKIRITTEEDLKALKKTVDEAEDEFQRAFGQSMYDSMKYVKASCEYESDDLEFNLLEFENGKAVEDNVKPLLKLMSFGIDEGNIKKLIKGDIIVIFRKGYDKYIQVFNKTIN
ncbi:MAG: hypothetical protein M0R46_15780 [Candidatus Muirbacterium halophilum]|nr:hypothetical protein [Candidatus Muirbacterium halophilum]